MSLTGGGWRTAGTGLTAPVNLLAEVVAGRSVVTDEVLSVQARQSRVASRLYVAAANIACPGPDDLSEVAGPPVAPVVPGGVLLEGLHLTVPTGHRPGPVRL